MADDDDDPSVNSDDLVVRAGSRVLVVVRPDGTVAFGKGYTPDSAALLFWTSVAKARQKAEQEQTLIYQHMEALLARLGQADLQCEEARRRAAMETDPHRRRSLHDAATLSMQQLEALVGQAIELGRALVKRPLPMPDMPADLPETVIDNPASDYQGRAGLPTVIEINVGPGTPPRGEA